MEQNDRRNNKRNKYPRKLISTDANFDEHIKKVAELLELEHENSLVIRQALLYVIQSESKKKKDKDNRDGSTDG